MCLIEFLGLRFDKFQAVLFGIAEEAQYDGLYAVCTDLLDDARL